MWELLNDHTFRTVGLGSAAIGAVSGGLGCFAYLRRQSLIGDVVSHSSLAGILLCFYLAYIFTGDGNKSLWVLMPGAIAAGLAALLLTRAITSRSLVKEDSSFGVMLALFFGGGILMLRWVQRTSPAIPGRAGLEDYLFGMAAAMQRSDLLMIGLLGAAAVGVTILFWKEFKLYTFDPAFAAGVGMRTRTLDNLLLLILVVAIVIGLQAVGVVLMIALLVAPASAARQWTGRLESMVVLAAIFGASCGAGGAVLSAVLSNAPTGPIIVLLATSIFILSLLFAPRRGLLSRAIRRWRQRQNTLASLPEGR